MSIADFVATLLDNLSEISPSTDRRGKPNWLKLSSTDHCWRCGGRFGDEIEPGSHVVHHIIPKSEGGSDSPDNKSLLCSNCHSVVHRYYLPNGKIGRKRTRDGASRLAGRFKGGVEIFKKLPNPDHSVGSCYDCRARGIVTGVSEGYWNGEGLLVFLDCPACGLKFAEPFIGTDEAPAIDPISVICLALTSGLKDAPKTLPPDLQARVDIFMNEMIKAMREFRSEMNSTVRNAKRAGCSDSEIASQGKLVREKYVDRIKLLLPEATQLQEECKPYRPR